LIIKISLNLMILKNFSTGKKAKKLLRAFIILAREEPLIHLL